MPHAGSDDPAIIAIAAKYGNAVSSSTPANPEPISTAEPLPLAGCCSRGRGSLSARSWRRHQITAPPNASATPSPVRTSYLTWCESFGSSDTIRSPSPSAITSPPASVTANAPSVNVAVLSTDPGPSVRYASATISDGLSESGNAIAITASARPATR